MLLVFVLVAAALDLFRHVVAASPLAAISSRPSVTIPVGTIIGKAEPVTSGSLTTTVYNYLAVPYAAAPTGSLRFAPPKTSVTLAKPVQATALPPACYQQYNFQPAIARQIQMELYDNPGGPPIPNSEDCLFLNIFAPTNASPSNKKAVMFYIPGGNLQFSSASQRYLNGSSFAGFQDVVVVSANYRTNIFGFSNSPQIATGQQNSGLLDQRAALKWVRSNIASFGGDPDAITVFGQSAGGTSVEQMMAIPDSPLPFRGAITQSSLISFTETGASGYQSVVQHFNCTTALSPIDCLRAVSADDIETYIETAGLSFAPVADNVTFVADIRPSILSKRFANVPWLMGTNSQEIPPGFLNSVLNSTADSSSLTPAQVFGQLFNNATVQQVLIPAYTSLTGNATLLVGSAIARVLTDFTITCHVGLTTETTVVNGYFNEWRYYYNASFPNLQIIPNAGAYHTSEIPQIWGTYLTQGATADQLGLSRFLQSTWASFAKNPANGPGWPRIGSSLFDLADLGGVKKTGSSMISRAGPDALCPGIDLLLRSQPLS